MKVNLLSVIILFLTNISFADGIDCNAKRVVFDNFLSSVLKPKINRHLHEVRLKTLPKGLPNNEFINIHLNTERLFFCDLFKDSESQPEFSKPFWAYDKSNDTGFVNKIKQVLEDYKSIFDELESTYSVDREVLASIWGKESKFGTIKGEVPVLQGVVFQAFRKNQSAELGFWDKNVIFALQIMHSYDLDYEEFLGSWAGAFGHMQFIPSTYNLLAVDQDGDGISTHWGEDPSDALASAAQLLKESGWNKNLIWGEEVFVPESFDYTEFLNLSDGSKKSMSQSYWVNSGFTKNIHGAEINWSELGKAYLISPQGSENVSYLLSSKFRKLKSYNNSDAYALSTLLLAERSKGNIVNVVPDINRRALSRPEKKLLQALLNKNGQNAGAVDGRIGTGTKRAVARYQGELGLSRGMRDGIPSEVLLLSLAEKYPDWTKTYIEVDNPSLSFALYKTFSKKRISYETRPLTYYERSLLQEKLKAEGLYEGKIDGIAGEGTKRAVLSFLNDSLPADSSYMSRDVYSLIISN